MTECLVSTPGAGPRPGRRLRRSTRCWPTARAGASRSWVLEFNHLGRESPTYLPGRVVGIDTELLTDGQIQAMGTRARNLHEAVTGFAHPWPWRFFHATTDHHHAHGVPPRAVSGVRGDSVEPPGRRDRL
jgi:hypothetical protein